MCNVVLTATGQRKADLFIRDITVFDPVAGTLVPHRDILVIDTKIVSVKPTGSSTPNAKVVIKGPGKFAIPGLFDNHIHTARLEKETAAVFLAFGVTSVRDLGSEPAKIQEWRKGIAHGNVLVLELSTPVGQCRNHPAHE